MCRTALLNGYSRILINDRSSSSSSSSSSTNTNTNPVPRVVVQAESIQETRRRAMMSTRQRYTPCHFFHALRPMSHLRVYRAILWRNFVATKSPYAIARVAHYTADRLTNMDSSDCDDDSLVSV